MMPKNNDSQAQNSTQPIDSATLFNNSNEVVIIHNGTPYRLRITRQDKLILTK
jgi:hemin uptake protein HemP